jgi:hypothetical protein
VGSGEVGSGEVGSGEVGTIGKVAERASASCSF